MSIEAVADLAEVAVIYARQSKDKRTSIDQQITVARTVTDDNGWTLGGVYSDGVSASRFATKGRADWTRLLGDLRANRFGVLILWETSRGDRDLPSWVTLLAECRERGVLIYVVTAERLYDCRIARDWKTLVEDGTDSAYESEKTSMRSKRNTDALAKAGRPHGMVAYGYKRVRTFDEAGRMVDSRDELLEEQADVIRETARRLFAGESLRSITKSLNERGVPSPKGGAWSSTQLRQVMLRDRNAGLRRHRGKVIGKAAWPPVYDEGTHDRVVARLTDPTRTIGESNKGATRKHLLSGLARCGRCGGPMRATPGTVHRGKTMPPRYQCADCLRVARKKSSLDQVVETLIVARLKQPDALRALAIGDPGRAEELTKLIADAEAQMARAVDKQLAGTWTEAQVDRLNAGLIPKIDTWKTERASCAPQEGLLDLLGPEAERRWAEAPLDVKRAVVDLLMTLTVLPSGSGRRFNPENVVFLEEGRVAEVDGQVRIEWKSWAP